MVGGESTRAPVMKDHSRRPLLAWMACTVWASTWATNRRPSATVIGLSRHGRPRTGFERVWPVAELADFLARADFLVSVLPDTPATRGLLDADAIAAMRRGAYFINVGRGSVVDEAALARALNEGHLGGAALDVFGAEPLPRNSPLWHAENTLVTAHVAARSWPRDIAAVFIDNFRRFAAGERLRYSVDFERGY